MYLCVWIEIFHAGCALTYSTSRGMISSDTLHSGCRKSLHSRPTCSAFPSGPLQTGLPLDDDLQLVRPPERLRQAAADAGERQTQSKYPLKGCDPTVSRNILSPCPLSAEVKGPNG